MYLYSAQHLDTDSRTRPHHAEIEWFDSFFPGLALPLKGAMILRAFDYAGLWWQLKGMKIEKKKPPNRSKPPIGQID
jgi:hypothetical protein